MYNYILELFTWNLSLLNVHRGGVSYDNFMGLLLGSNLELKGGTQLPTPKMRTSRYLNSIDESY